MSLIRTLLRIGWWLILIILGVVVGWLVCSFMMGAVAIEKGLWGQMFLFVSGVFLMCAGIVSLIWNIGGVRFLLNKHRRIAEEAAEKAVKETATSELIEETVKRHRMKIYEQELRKLLKIVYENPPTQDQMREKEGERK